ncbi:MAG: DUF1156 domain-containing protein [Anaerolineae bacterium]
MIPQSCKRLAEVDFPIAEVSKHAAREKSIRHGHPSTLHLWWARRPLAACRAMLMALLLPDPCDPLCPPEFKTEARRILLDKHGRPSGWDATTATDLGLRQVLLQFIGDFANWDVATDKDYLAAARGLVKAAHPEETPLVVDPFAGGGSIPLEALRLGCDAFASDLNPVACLIEKVMLEDIPRSGPELADELRRVGAEIKAAAEKELAEFYPPDPDGARPIAYLWARTIKCDNCGAEIPLMRSFWLSKKTGRKRALRYQIIRKRGEIPTIEFEIFNPTKETEVPQATVSRAKATCACCHVTTFPDRVRAQLREQHGGADVIFDANGKRRGGAFLLAVVLLIDKETGRHYRLPTQDDYQAIWKATRRLQKVAQIKLSNNSSAIPDEPTPVGGGSGAGRAFSVRNYGMMTFRDLFTARQNLSLFTFSKKIAGLQSRRHTIALALGKLVDLANVICPWEPNAECPRNILSLGRIKTAWDFAEGVPISESSGSFTTCVDNLVNGVIATRGIEKTSSPEIAPAQQSPLPTDSASIWFTDPPYYDAIPYSDLSDMFFVWYKRALPDMLLFKDPLDPNNPLTPKALEAIEDEGRTIGGNVKDKEFFEKTMTVAFGEGHRILHDDGVGCVVFAHKTTEGWEALLGGMIRGSFVITGSWPIATEQAYRLRARDSAALATSVHLVCRPRPADAPIGDWSDVLRELPKRVSEWMERLQAEGVRGADLVFACIGPALEVYSRYSKVVDAEDREIPLGGDPEAKEPYQRGFLAYVWETVGRAALEQVLGSAEAHSRDGAAGALEEDSRLTALFLWTLQSTEKSGPLVVDSGQKKDEEETEEAADEGDEDEDAPRKKAKGFSLVYDVARRFAQPLGIHLQDWEGRIIETDKGVVRLLPVTERAAQLFGEEGAEAVAADLEERQASGKAFNYTLFPDEQAPAPRIKGRGGRRQGSGANVPDEALQARREATTLDRVHAAMLLQKSGRTNALRALLQAETDRGPGFLRLANSLSALYPRESEEKRLLDAMLLALPR